MTTTTADRRRAGAASDIHIVREYPHPLAKVWRALTEPALMARWMIAARPEGFATAVGTQFKFVGKKQIGWSGVVDGVVLEAREPTLFRYSWSVDGGDPTEVTYRLEPISNGTRFTFEHTGFAGIAGFLLAKVVMTPIRKKMFGTNMRAVLDDDDRDER